jgi:hypothetical protein
MEEGISGDEKAVRLDCVQDCGGILLEMNALFQLL